MTNENKLEHAYIAREILIDDHDVIRIDEEGVFSSFEKARAFLQHIRDEREYQNDPSPSDVYFRHEIKKHHINDYEDYNTEITWTYKVTGELISKYDAQDEIPNSFESVSYDSLYELGEIVRVKSNFEEPESHLTRENYGVIAQTPVAKEDWKASGKPLEDWDGAYIVYLISDDTNLLYHEHLSEICLDTLSGDLPEDLDFLNLLSDYFKNDGNVPAAEDIQKAIDEKVVVRKINYFFDNRS